MTALHIRRHIDSDTLTIPELRELIGRDVEIVVREVEEPQPTAARIDAECAEATEDWKDSYPLRGSVLRYDDPFEPVGVDDWEALE